MGTLSKEGIQLVCDSVLIRNALVLKHSLEVIEELGDIPHENRHIKEIRHSLQLMEEEIERRGLKIPEGEELSGFLQGMEYTSEPRSRGSSGGMDSRISRASARVLK